MFDPATLAMLIQVGLPIAQSAFSALSNKNMGGVRSKTAGGAGGGSLMALPQLASAVPAASAAMPAAQWVSGAGLTNPSNFAGAASAAGGGGGMMGTLGSIGSALGGSSGMGSALGSMLAGGFGGGDGGPTSSTTTSTTDNIPFIFGKTRDKWLNTVGVNRAQQQARNQMVMGMPLFAKDMLSNFLSGSAWGRTLGGGMAGYQPKDPFAQIRAYPTGNQDYSSGDPISQEIARDIENNPGTYQPEWYPTYKPPEEDEPEGKMWGGPVLKTKKYTVGEAGPETYLPPMGGQMRTLGGQGQTVNTLQRGGYVVPNPNTMLRSTGTVRPGIGASGNEKGTKNPTGNTLLPNPALATQSANNALAGTGASILPDPITRNAFSPSLIQQMTARSIEGANMQTRNRNAMYAGQMNAAGLTGPNIGAVLSQPSSMDAMRAGAQGATDTQLSGMSMGLNQQQLANQYYLQMLQMLLGGMMGSELALPPSGSIQKSTSTTTME